MVVACIRAPKLDELPSAIDVIFVSTRVIVSIAYCALLYAPITISATLSGDHTLPLVPISYIFSSVPRSVCNGRKNLLSAVTFALALSRMSHSTG